MDRAATDAGLARLARLGDRLEFAAAAGMDAVELDPMVAEIDRLARSFDPDALTGPQRAEVAGLSAQVARILALLSDRQAQDVAAQSREARLRRAYGAGH